MVWARVMSRAGGRRRFSVAYARRNAPSRLRCRYVRALQSPRGPEPNAQAAMRYRLRERTQTKNSNQALLERRERPHRPRAATAGTARQRPRPPARSSRLRSASTNSGVFVFNGNHQRCRLLPAALRAVHEMRMRNVVEIGKWHAEEAEWA